jgi:acetyl/propionyl-CoA carboxylase alpha subunit
VEALVIRFRAGDRVLGVSVKRVGDRFHATVEGETMDFGLEEISPGTFILRTGARAETVYLARQDAEVHLFFRGAAHLLREERENESARESRAHAGDLEAPMPGKIIKLNVVPGQAVTKGEEVLVVEAMKMENAVRASRDGVVKTVAVKVGDMVQTGIVLVEIG